MTILSVDNEENSNVTEVSSVANFTTPSDTDVLIDGMTITPGAGTWFVISTGMMSQDVNTKESFVSIYQNGAQVPHSERHHEKAAGAHAHRILSMSAVCTVAAGQAIELRGRTSAGGQMDADERSMSLWKIQ